MRTSPVAGTFLTLLFLVSKQLTAIGGTAYLPFTEQNHALRSVQAPKIHVLSSDTLDSEQCEMLIELAQYASRHGDLRRARQHYLQAFGSVVDSKSHKYLLSFLTEISGLYTRIAQTDSALYDSLAPNPIPGRITISK